MEVSREPALREVTPLELLFDLVFVLAIGQLSHRLLDHPTWTGAAQVLVLYLAVFAAWAYTTWAVTLVPGENPRTQRMLLAVMLAGLFMNAAIPRAFDDAGWVFVVGYLLIHVGRTIWLLTVGLEPVNQEHFFRMLAWVLAAAPFWVLGATSSGGARLAWWAGAGLVELAGTWTAHPFPGRRLDSRQVSFAGTHLLERCRLFLLIAFGETVLSAGAGLTAAPIEVMTGLTAGVALAGTVAMFWLYFGPEHTVRRYIQRTEDPMHAGRRAVYSLMFSVAGVIAAGAGDERVIAHPTGHAGVTTNLLLFGGPALYVGAQTWYGATLLGELRWSRVLAIPALVVGGVATLAAPAYAAGVVGATILVVLAYFRTRPSPGSDPSSTSTPTTTIPRERPTS